MRAKNGPGFQARPSLYADDFLEPDERAHFGDDVALDIAVERHNDACRRHIAPTIDPDADLLTERPDVDENRTDAAAREVLDWRAAVIDGRPLAWRPEGGKR